jgi:hypothetical protein
MKILTIKISLLDPIDSGEIRLVDPKREQTQGSGFAVILLKAGRVLLCPVEAVFSIKVFPRLLCLKVGRI